MCILFPFRSVVLAVISSILLIASASAAELDAAAVKLMTFNLRIASAEDGPNGWQYRREMVCDVIKKFAPDFLGTQEAEPDQVAYLRERFPSYGCIARNSDDVRPIGKASALYYDARRWQLDPEENGTFWLSETPEVVGSKAWGAAFPRVVTWGRFIEKTVPDGKTAARRTLYVYNTHFDHKSPLACEKSSELISRRIAQRKHGEPVILMGDFNSGESTRQIGYLTGRVPGGPLKLVDTFRAVHPDAKEAGTFCNFAGIVDGEKIDYIFALPGAKVSEAEIIRDNRDGRYPSDHFPVTAVVHPW